MKKLDLKSSHDTKATLDFAMVSSHSLQMCRELLCYSISHFSFFQSDLIEHVGRIVSNIVSVFCFLLHILFIAESITSLAE